MSRDELDPRALLQKHGLRAKYSWGQNFLSDPWALEQIAEATHAGPGTPLLELGPGLGHLTRALIATGASVTAVERDRDMVRVLRESEITGLKLVEANAADVDFAATAGVDQVTVVGNLPYHLTSSILFQVLDQHVHVPRAVFTLQKEVVTRITAEPGGRDYGILPVLLGLHYHAEQVAVLPAHLFHPPPKVDSAVLRLDRLAAPRAAVTDEAHFRRVVKAAFAQRRKTVLNSLKSDSSLGEGPALAAALEKAGVDPQRRAETLSVPEFAALERALAG